MTALSLFQTVLFNSYINESRYYTVLTLRFLIYHVNKMLQLKHIKSGLVSAAIRLCRIQSI